MYNVPRPLSRHGRKFCQAWGCIQHQVQDLLSVHQLAEAMRLTFWFALCMSMLEFPPYITELANFMPTSDCLMVCGVQLRGKAMKDKAGDLMALMRDILLTAKLDDAARFKQMVR
jgi:hypothetical protein